MGWRNQKKGRNTPKTTNRYCNNGRKSPLDSFKISRMKKCERGKMFCPVIFAIVKFDSSSQQTFIPQTKYNNSSD